jgi:CRP/FNR family transcriptional regulator, cyclic AMP receptor protein
MRNRAMGHASLLEAAPHLARSIPAEQRAAANARSRVAVLRLAPQEWDPAILSRDPAIFGAYVLSGFVSNRVVLGARSARELLGPGDLIRPAVGREPASTLSWALDWHVHTRTEIALLDAGFARRLAPWPEVFGLLVESTVLRARRMALQAAINAVPLVQERLWLTLWELADRWGSVTAQGVRLSLPLRHHELASLISARRPSVTTALGNLRRDGRLAPTAGGWLLLGGPPHEHADPAPRLPSAVPARPARAVEPVG